MAVCLAFADDSSFAPADVKIVGALDYGQTSGPVEYAGTPPYVAFVFNGNSGDKIDVSVKDDDHKAFIAIADGTLKQLTSDTDHIAFTLPNAGPDLATYYIVFREPESKAARYTVTLKKIEAPPAR